MLKFDNAGAFLLQIGKHGVQVPRVGKQLVVHRKRLAIPLARHQRKGNVVERILVVRTLSEHTLEVCEGLRKAFKLQERNASGSGCKTVIRRQRQRAIEGLDRFLAAVECVEREPAGGQHIDVLRLDRKSAVIGGECFLMTAQIEQHRRPIAPVRKRLRRQPQCTIVALDRLARPAQLDQHIGPIAMSIGQIRRKRDRAIEARQRLMERARLRQCHAEEKMRARASSIDGERLPRIRDPLPQAPHLAGRESKLVEVISRFLQDMPLELDSIGSRAKLRGPAPLCAIRTIVV